MALTQIDHIHALDETLRGFERELQWGVSPRDLGHLVERIGQIFAAICSNGQIVPADENCGYSVVGYNGDRYLVQCVSGDIVGGEINFTHEQLEKVDRVCILFFSTDEIEINTLLDTSVERLARYVSHHHGNKLIVPLLSLVSSKREPGEIKVTRTVQYKDYVISERENGGVDVASYGNLLNPVKPILLKLAAELDVPLFNGMERSRNTRLLGTQVIQAIEQLQAKKR